MVFIFKRIKKLYLFAITFKLKQTVIKTHTGFIQGSLSKFKDFSRTSQDYFTAFKD